MIPAEGTDRINDLIYFPQRHTVHLAVQLIEIRLYLRIIHQPQFHRASVRLPDLRSENAGADHYSIYILHSDLTQENRELIRKTGGHAELHFITIYESIFDGFPETNRYPKQIYYRLAVPLLLPS